MLRTAKLAQYVVSRGICNAAYSQAGSVRSESRYL